MTFDIRRGLVVVTCVSVGFVVSAGPGLVARAAEPERWVGALTAGASTSAARDLASQRRISELELLVKELEAERSGVEQRGEKLAAALARNEDLVARNRALSLENQDLVQSRAFERSDRTAAACEPPNDADPATQVRYWAKQLRDSETASGWLSPERNAAVNVLLRRERQLDPRNPWREL